jgi:predicted transcriptional regulator
MTILYEMLTLCQTGPVKKTHLMYRANLSHRTLTKFLSVLLDKGLCTEESHDGTTVYRITARGRRFLHEYRTIRSFFDEERRAR